MKFKLILIITLIIGQISFTGCSTPDESKKIAEQAANNFLSQIYTIEAKSGADALTMPEKINTLVNEKFNPLMTQEGLEQLINNSYYSGILISCGRNQRSIKMQDLELTTTSFNDYKGIIYFDYKAKIEITSENDNKTSTVEERGNIGLSLNKKQWKIFSLNPISPSHLLIL